MGMTALMGLLAPLAMSDFNVKGRRQRERGAPGMGWWNEDAPPAARKAPGGSFLNSPGRMSIGTHKVTAPHHIPSRDERARIVIGALIEKPLTMQQLTVKLAPLEEHDIRVVLRRLRSRRFQPNGMIEKFVPPPGVAKPKRVTGAIVETRVATINPPSRAVVYDVRREARRAPVINDARVRFGR